MLNPGASGPSTTTTTKGGPSLLFALLRSWGAKLYRLTSSVGRANLYVGILFTAWPAVRLPQDIGALSDLFLVLSVVCALLVSWDRTFDLRLFKIHAIGLGLIMVGAAVSSFDSSSTSAGFANIMKFVFTTTLTFFAALILLGRRRHLVTACACWVASAAISSGVAIFETSSGVSLLTGGAAASARLAGLAGNANHFGVAAAMTLPVSLSLAARSSQVSGKNLWLFGSFMCVAAVVMSASRTAALIAGLALLLWVIAYYRSDRGFALAIAGACLAAAAVAVYFHETAGGKDVTDRLTMAVVEPESDSAIQSRLDQYDAVLRAAMSRPVVGVGFAPEDLQVLGRQIHNMFFIFLYGGGLIAFFGILLIVTDILNKGKNAIAAAATRRDLYALAAGLSIAPVGIVVAGMTGTLFYRREVWIAGALLFSLTALIHRERHRRRAPSNNGSRRRRRRSRADVSVGSLSAVSRSRHRARQGHDDASR